MCWLGIVSGTEVSYMRVRVKKWIVFESRSVAWPWKRCHKQYFHQQGTKTARTRFCIVFVARQWRSVLISSSCARFLLIFWVGATAMSASMMFARQSEPKCKRCKDTQPKPFRPRLPSSRTLKSNRHDRLECVAVWRSFFVAYPFIIQLRGHYSYSWLAFFTYAYYQPRPVQREQSAETLNNYFHRMLVFFYHWRTISNPATDGLMMRECENYCWVVSIYLVQDVTLCSKQFEHDVATMEPNFLTTTITLYISESAGS